jgi:hypothetical protein
VAKKELEVLYGDKLLSASSGKTGRIAFSLKATLGGSGDDGDGDGFPDPDPRTLRTLDHIYLSVGRLRLIDPEPSLSPTCPPSPPPSDGSSSGKRSMDTVAFAKGLELLKSRWPLATRRWSARYAPPTVALPKELEAEQGQGERREEDGPVATFRVDSSRVSWVVKHTTTRMFEMHISEMPAMAWRCMCERRACGHSNDTRCVHSPIPPTAISLPIPPGQERCVPVHVDRRQHTGGRLVQRLCGRATRVAGQDDRL